MSPKWRCLNLYSKDAYCTETPALCWCWSGLATQVFSPAGLLANRAIRCCDLFLVQWRLFIFISRESKWVTLQSAGNPRCAVPAEIHSICTDRPRPGPAAGLQVSPTSDTSQSVAILMNRPHCNGSAEALPILCVRYFRERERERYRERRK